MRARKIRKMGSQEEEPQPFHPSLSPLETCMHKFRLYETRSVMWQNTKLHMINSRLLNIMHGMSAYGWTSSFPTEQLWISITPTTRCISLLRAAVVLLLCCCSATSLFSA
ncbi:uncharacterized protein LOC110709456 [Chenopodium quinoa]|uniref:uncharacterized protein LOC110709456 n=1 Tax=Chenopodium quinoa TaxID=63459 RepID=UPI000B7771BD|nr:uncharacterized protein LOC110709456 [Chenopodium quinoa]XP_021743372.1 uncharacterized protein LOC110709456 [Chenopodium quinoa]